MQTWVALSDRDGVLGGHRPDGLMAQGKFVLEFDLPLTGAVVLLDYQTTENWPRAFSVFVDEAAGVVVLHRQGNRLIRHVLPGPLGLGGDGAGRIVFGWNGPAKGWALSLEQPGTGTPRATRGRDPMPMLLADLLAICRGAAGSKRHPAVLWFGATLGDTPPERAPWVGLHTRIDTPDGPRLANTLRPGDLVMTASGLTCPIASVRRMDLPSRGSFSPVLLRAPYFGAISDLLVASDQLVLVSGAEVEYLFGDENVLIEARHLLDGRAALLDMRRAVTSCLSFDLDWPELLRADGCFLLSHHHGPVHTQPRAPFRVLHGYEVIPLLASLGRGFGRNAA